MVHSKVTVCLILATQLLFYCEGSQFGRQNTDQPSRRHRSSAQVNENDNERDLQVSIYSENKESTNITLALPAYHYDVDSFEQRNQSGIVDT